MREPVATAYGNAVRPDCRGLATAAAAVCLLAGCEQPADPAPEPPVDEVEVVGRASVTIDTDADRLPISPFIYGSNQDRDPADRWTVRRLGGNRLTGYNWENNYSNAGSDFQHSSDRFLITEAGIPAADATIPARVVTEFHRRSLETGAATIVTLQMAGYVAADDAGPVSASETAPSPRWLRAEPRKGAPFSTAPDPADDAVYMDELVALLANRYGGGNSVQGVRWYSLDNEPALWAHTHPRIHPEPVRAEDLVERSVALAAAVKEVDPDAQILGPALYGMAAYLTLQDAPDWGAVAGGHDWFIDYYLRRMREAAEGAGRRLLDVLDVHWYPEARGDHRITEPGATTPADVEARLQAPRTLWQHGYRENSWIGDFFSGFLPILPRLQRSIAEHYPGTRLAVTEYDYGAGSTVSGGIAQADVLGAFGRTGVYIATIWGIAPDDVYTAAAFRLYRDYDGQRGTFGSTSVRAAASDPVNTSAHASIDGDDASVLHVILLNKNRDGGIEVTLDIHGSAVYGSGDVWAFSEGSSAITRRSGVTALGGNRFRYTVPALTAAHVVLRP